MISISLAMAMCVGGCGSESPQDWAKQKLEKSPRHGEWVLVQHGSRMVHTFVVYPEVKEKAPCVIVIHEIFGMTDWVQSVADQLAAAGFIALAPDLLSGMAPGGGRSTDFADTSAARQAIGSLPPDQITADLGAVCDYAKKLPAANGNVAVGGFCWGGSQTFRFATNRSDLSAAFPFYGSAPTDKTALGKINCPVYGFYAENDARINATIPDTEAAMKDLGKTYQPATYAGAGHGFMRAGEAPDSNEANKKGREAGWVRWLELLRKAFGVNRE